MVQKYKQHLDKIRHTLIYELIFAGLAILSIVLLLVEIFADIEAQTRTSLIRFDFWIAVIFLADYITGQLIAKDNWSYFKNNWYLLLASIPINEYVFRSLRILRALRVIRVWSALSRTLYIPEFLPRWSRRLSRNKRD